MANTPKFGKIVLYTMIPLLAATMTACSPGRVIPRHGPDDEFHTTTDVCSRRSGAALSVARDLYHDPSISEFEIPGAGDKVYDTAGNWICDLTWYTDSTGHATEAHYYVSDANRAPPAASSIDAMQYAKGDNGFTSPAQAPVEESKLEETVVQATQPSGLKNEGLMECWYRVLPGDSLMNIYFNSDYAEGLQKAYGDYSMFEQDVVFRNGLKSPDSINADQQLSMAVTADTRCK